MTNARAIIEQAASDIAVLGRGQVLSADETDRSLKKLNLIAKTLSSEATCIFNNVRETFPLTGAASYTVGVGGDFNTSLPMELTAVYVSIGSIDYPLRQMTPVEYANVGFKAIGGVPDSYYFENNTPISRIFFYPVPTAATSVTLYNQKALDTFTDLTTDYDMPPGAEPLFVALLAVALCPSYEKPVSADLLRNAKIAKKNFETYNKRQSYPTSQLDMTDPASPTGNIYSGWYV